METKQFEELKDQLVKAVDESLQEVYNFDRKFMAQVQKTTLKSFKHAPNDPIIVDTIKGILGFKIYLTDENKFDHSTFLTNALHDMNECIQNWVEDWYSPRTNRYVEYYRVEI